MSSPGYTDNKAAVLLRLKKIEGQVRGISRMVEEDTYCIDVLTQIAAINKATHAVALNLLEDHMRHCVANAVKGSKREAEEKFEEVTAAVERIWKS